MLEIGTILGDRYEILELIGSGGMADVYKAKCHKLNRFVAIKVLKPEFSSDSSFVSKFKAEAQSAAGLMHPNIVNVYDVGEENRMYYFVMELVEGITLKHYIEKKIRLTMHFRRMAYGSSGQGSSQCGVHDFSGILLSPYLCP